MNSFSYRGPMIADKEEDLCRTYSNPCQAPGKDCEQQCRNVEKARAFPEFTRELMEFSVPPVNEFEANSPTSLLPSCDWARSGECWQKVITDRGTCFKSETFGSL